MNSFPDNWQEIAWNKLSDEIKVHAVERLHSYFVTSFFDDVRRLAEEKGLGEWLPMGWHFSQGMFVRNLLRSNSKELWMDGVGAAPNEPILDEELPGLPELYGENESTWDDFYVAIIEAAAGLREVPKMPEPKYKVYQDIPGMIPFGNWYWEKPNDAIWRHGPYLFKFWATWIAKRATR